MLSQSPNLQEADTNQKDSCIIRWNEVLQKIQILKNATHQLALYTSQLLSSTDVLGNQSRSSVIFIVRNETQKQIKLSRHLHPMCSMHYKISAADLTYLSATAQPYTPVYEKLSVVIIIIY